MQKYYDNPDITFIVNDENGYLTLEIGEEYYDLTDRLSDEEVIEWALDQNLLDADEDELDVDFLREQHREQEEDKPNRQTYPAGRAYDYLIVKQIPSTIKLEFIYGDEHSGSSWCGVRAENSLALAYLQEYLETKNVRVNYAFRTQLNNN